MNFPSQTAIKASAIAMFASAKSRALSTWRSGRLATAARMALPTVNAGASKWNKAVSVCSGVRTALSALQETVISVAKKMPEFKADPAAGSFKSWLLTLTRWRIIDQMRRRKAAQASNGFAETVQAGAGGTPALPCDDSTRTSTVDRLPNPAGQELDAIWNKEWENNLLVSAAERVKRLVDPEQFQLFDFHVLKQWPAKKVARKLGVNLGQVYFAKYKISKLMKREIRKLERQMT